MCPCPSRVLALAASAWLGLLPSAASGELFAEQLDAQSAARLRPGGVDAIAGVGDWVLGNGVVCAAVSDAAHQTGLSTRGGALIDVAHCGRNDDQFTFTMPMLNLGRTNSVAFERVYTQIDSREARVLAEATVNGLNVLRTHAVRDDGEPVVRVITRVERREPGPRLSVLGEITLHPSASLSAFGLSTRSAGQSRGFRHPDVDPDRMSTVIRSFVTSDVQVLVGDAGLDPPIAYGLRLVSAELVRVDGTRARLPFASTTGRDFTMHAVFARPFWLGSGRSVGLLQLGQMGLMDLRPGDRIVVEREVWLGERADVASATDRLHADGFQVSGRLDDPHAVVHVDDFAGEPITQAQPDSGGSFALKLPDGAYRLRARAPGGRALDRDFRVDGADVDVGALELGSLAHVELPQGQAMRLVFVGLDGTPDPTFNDDARGYAFGDERVAGAHASNDVALGGVPGDPAHVELPTGRYRVWATRGPEFDVQSAEIEVAAGAETALAIATPQRAVQTPGWIGADLHVHAAPSFDSGIGVEARVRSFLAQGGEVMVSTEHNRVYDFAPVVARLGAAERMRSVVGTEITSTVGSPAAPHTFGHANAFPVPFDPLAHRGGAIPFNGRRLRAAIADVRALPGPPLFQLNHPTSYNDRRIDGSLFTHLSVPGEAFDPTRPLDAEPNRALVEPDPRTGLRDADFDAVELLNGPHMGRYAPARAAWHALLRQGERRTGTANSDSHGAGELVALPRTYIRVSDDRPSEVDIADLIGAIRAGRVVGTTGPLLNASLEGVRIGDTLSASSAELHVDVRSAPWIPVDTLRVYVGGRVAAERRIDGPGPHSVQLQFDRDTYVTVEVQGPATEPYSDLAPGLYPLAFTNPIYVDADADGAWTPPLP